MTVAIGLICTDGVVVAADSMSTTGSVAAKGQKVHALERLPVVWTAAGAVYTIEEVETALAAIDAQSEADATIRERYTTPDLTAIRQQLSTELRAVMQRCYASHLPMGNQAVVQSPMGPRHLLSSDFLVLGWASGPFFLELAGDGQVNWHMDKKFYAVGSGGEFATVAQALMAHHLEEGDLDVHLGLRVAYRAIDTTCQVSSAHVGPPVQLAVATAKGARVLTEEEVDEVESAVGGWKQVERETLRELAATEPKEAGPGEIAADLPGIADG